MVRTYAGHSEKFGLDAAAAAREHVVDDRLQNFVRFHCGGYRNAQPLSYLARLAYKHIQHCEVNLVVAAPKHHTLDLWRSLPVAVDAPFTLLQPVGIPRKIIVQHGVEVLLQVDALAQAVGRHQHSARSLRQFIDYLSALLVVSVTTRDRAYFDVRVIGCECLLKLLCNIPRGGDETAIDDGTIALRQHIGDDIVASSELGVEILSA